VAAQAISSVALHWNRDYSATFVTWIEPNRPSASPFGPAVKYSLLGSVADSLPNVIDQSPSIEIG